MQAREKGLARRKRALLAFAAIVALLVIPTAASGAPGDVTASPVADIRNGFDGSEPNELFNAGGTLLFAAHDGTNGGELWKSDGTGPGTVMLEDDGDPGGISDGSGDSNPQEFASIGNIVFFQASDGTTPSVDHGRELWKIESPYTTPVRVTDINPDEGHSSPEELTNVNGTLLFRADDGSDGEELWKLPPPYTDATQVADINNSGGSFPAELTEVNGLLFFIANDGNGDEVWKSVPSFTGATMVEDIDPTGSAVPSGLINVSGTLFFQADNGSTANGAELWKSVSPNYDASSTSLVRDINTTSTGADSNPVDLTNVNGALFFEADDGVNGQDLWKSVVPFNAGSTTIIDVNPGSGASDPDELTDVDGTLFFRAHGASGGTELWKSNGGAVGAGTEMVADINPSGSSTPAQITGVAGQVFFRATDGTTGNELWKSAAPFTAATRVADINLTPTAGSTPDWLTDVNGTLFFNANDGVTGEELWKATIEQPPPPAPAPTPATTVPPEEFNLKAAIKKCKKKFPGKAKAKKRNKCIRKAKAKARA